MADTTFVAKATTILAAWLNDINAGYYRANSAITGVTSAMYRTILAKAGDYVSVKDFGATGDGSTDDSTAVQAALSSGALSVYFPKGTYILGTTCTIPSSVRVCGSGWGSIIKAKSTLASTTLGSATVYVLLTNSTPTGGNSKILIEDLAFDMTNKDVAGAHCVHLRNCTNSHVRRCSTQYGDDGVAMTLANGCTISHCDGREHANAAFDMWETTIDSAIINNNIYGSSGGRGQLYGILVTGLTILDVAATSSRVKVQGNTIYGVQGPGIWIQGGVVGAQTGAVTYCNVTGNIIGNMISNAGIRLSEGTGHVVANNIIASTWQGGIQIQGEASAGAAGAAQNCIIKGNYLTGINGSTNGGIDAIFIGNSGNGTLVEGNTVITGLHKYALSFGSTTSGCKQANNILGAGATGIVSDAGGTNLSPQFAARNSAGTAPAVPGPTDIPFATVSFNQGTGYATPTFTAPRTGKYQFNWNITHTSACTAGNVFEISLVTTARTYTWAYTVAAAENTLAGSCLADMTATDTAKLQITRTTGAGTFTLVATAAKNNFTGFLREEYV